MTTSSKRRLSVLLIGLAIVTTQAVAQAQPAPTTGKPSAADLESARELFKAGRELRQHGDLPRALEKFKAAHAYGQTPVTALELGRTHMQLGELVEAREVLLSVARMKVEADETDKSADARAEAAELAEGIKGRIATIVVKLAGVGPNADVQLTIDGAAVPVVSLGAMRKTNPGKHVVVARADGKQATRDVDVPEGQTRDVTIDVSGPGSTSPATGPETATAPSAGRTISPVTWVGLAAGVVGIGVGAVTGAMALGKASSVEKACSGTQCPPAARSDVDDGRSVATISTIGFGVGIVGLAVAAVGYFVLSKPSASAMNVSGFVTANGGGLGGRF